MNVNQVDIPKYETIAGNMVPIGSTRKGLQICIQNTTVEECRNYAHTLEEAGFRLYAVNEVSAGSEKAYNKNLFYTFTREDVFVFLSWNASILTTRIVVEPLQALPATVKPVLMAEDVVVPTITQMQLASGMSYVTQLPDGSFIVMDGGNYKCGDVQRLYEFMANHSKDGNKPVIAAWMFTHPHRDHISIAAEFIREHVAHVDIKAFAYQFQDPDWMNTSLESEEEKQGVSRLENAIAECYPEAVIYTLHTGQIYYFKGLEIEILCTGDDIYPAVPLTYNDVSAAWRMTFDNGKTVMILGDCMQRECRQLAHTYGDYLKSDILQVTHHGLIGGDKGLYQLIDPEICFWPTRENRFNGTASGQKYQWCLGEGGCDYNTWIRDSKIRVRKHYNNSTTTTISMEEGKDNV